MRGGGEANKHIAERLADIRYTKSVTWEAYFRSIGEIKKETVKTRVISFKRSDLKLEIEYDMGDGETIDIPVPETTVTTEIQNGDPRYLAIIADCIKQERALLGLDKPKKTEISGRDGKPIETNVNLTADEAIQKIFSIINGAKNRKALE